MEAPAADRLAGAVLQIDAWLDTMRCYRGYGGPVAHRWQDCLIYTGPGFDWRYEGIILGYLRLCEVTGEKLWLAKARRAGDDLRSSQLSDGRYPASSFEANPAPGGTPHEAGCDLALLYLAARLKGSGEPGWEDYLATARRNLVDYHIRELWDPARSSFRNLPGDRALVPNKIATLVQAGFALAKLEGSDELLEQIFLPALDSVLAAQVQGGSRRLVGAIDQSIAGRQPGRRYFPFYVARCVPALLAGFAHKGLQVYLDAAISALAFVFRQQLPDGSFPQVLYSNGQQTVEPRWIAGCGDILRAARLLAAYGFSPPGRRETEEWLLAGILPSGGVRTASGFSALTGRRTRGGLPDFRDLLPACGWVDKAFHCLAWLVPDRWQRPEFAGIDQACLPCSFQGQEALFAESETSIEVHQAGRVRYHWRKGSSWASFC